MATNTKRSYEPPFQQNFIFKFARKGTIVKNVKKITTIAPQKQKASRPKLYPEAALLTNWIHYVVLLYNILLDLNFFSANKTTS